jgi:hypothetical protein
VGILTVLVVLVVLLLCSFAIMSLLSANADARLTYKAKQSVSDYYAADAKAERIVAGIDAALRAGGDTQNALAALGVSTTYSGDSARFSFEVAVGDGRTLHVELKAPLLGGRIAGTLSRLRWQID